MSARYLWWLGLLALVVLVSAAFWPYFKTLYSGNFVVVSYYENGDFSGLAKGGEAELMAHASRFYGEPKESVKVESGWGRERFWVAIYYPDAYPIPDWVNVEESIDGVLCNSETLHSMADYLISDFYVVKKGQAGLTLVVSCSQDYVFR